jgi:hypothetical protein
MRPLMKRKHDLSERRKMKFLLRNAKWRNKPFAVRIAGE